MEDKIEKLVFEGVDTRCSYNKLAFEGNKVACNIKKHRIAKNDIFGLHEKLEDADNETCLSDLGYPVETKKKVDLLVIAMVITNTRNFPCYRRKKK